jgi:hypothetical protein
MTGKSPRVLDDRGRVVLAYLQVFGCLAIGMTVLLVYAFPGFMSPDSVQQMEQARSHQYGDWHPPTMAAIWTLVEHVVKGPAGMLILQGSMFLGGLFLLLRRYMPPRAAALTASGVLIFPPVLVVIACIWKDAQMAGFLILGIALLLEPRPWQKVIAIVLLVIASALRDNAAPAILPILLLTFQWGKLAGWKRVAAAAALWVLIVGMAFGLNRSLTKVHEHSWTVSLAPADIIGVLKHSRDYSDEELLTIIDPKVLVKTNGIQAHARTFYNPYAWFWYESPGKVQLFWWPQNPEQRAAVTRAWKKLVLDNPRAYLRHRLRVFRGVLGLTKQPLFGPVWATHYDVQRPDGQRFYDAEGIQQSLAKAFTWLATKTPLFYPYIYMLILLVMVPVMWRRRTGLAIVVSGLLYELALFPFAPSADTRYSHWPTTAAVLAIIMVIAQRVWRQREAAPSS